MSSKFDEKAPVQTKIISMSKTRLVILQLSQHKNSKHKRYVLKRISNRKKTPASLIPENRYLNNMKGRWYLRNSFMRTKDEQWMDFSKNMTFTGLEITKSSINGIYSLQQNRLTIIYKKHTLKLKIIKMSKKEILCKYKKKYVVFSRSRNILSGVDHNLPPKLKVKKITFPENEKGARKLLRLLIHKDMDLMKTMLRLRPSKKDYRAFFSNNEIADFAWRYDYNKLWKPAELIYRNKPFKSLITRFTLKKTTTDKFHENGWQIFTSGYYNNAYLFKKGITVYSFRLYKAGKKNGSLNDCLVYINGRWVLFYKAWKVGRKLPDSIRNKHK